MREETLTAALRAAMEDDLAALWAAPEGEEPDWSPAYRAWETDFLARRSAPARPPRRRGRVLLVAAAVLAVLVTGAVAAAPWIENAILRTSGESVDFIYTPAGTEPIPLGEWRPAWLPEGLVLCSVHEETGNGSMIVYDDGDDTGAPEDGGAYLSLWYDALDENFEVRTGSQTGLTAVEIAVNGCSGYAWTDGRTYHHLVWIDEEQQVGFSLIYLGPSAEEALRVAESVTLVP